MMGFRNYINLFRDKDVLHAYAFTIEFAVICTIAVNILSLILACALNAKIKYKNFLKAVYFLPYMLGTLIVGYIFNYIFSALLPQVGTALGIEWMSRNLLGGVHAKWGIILLQSGVPVRLTR